MALNRPQKGQLFAVKAWMSITWLSLSREHMHGQYSVFSTSLCCLQVILKTPWILILGVTNKVQQANLQIQKLKIMRIKCICMNPLCKWGEEDSRRFSHFIASTNFIENQLCFKPKKWDFWTVVLEKILESPLDCKEIKPINHKRSQSWIFIGRTHAEAEAPTFWPPDVKGRLIGKDPDAGKHWKREEKGTTEEEMDDRGWDAWMASPTQWTWVWASSWRWWRTEKPGMLQSVVCSQTRLNNSYLGRGAVLNIVGCWAVSLVFTCSMPVSTPSPPVMIIKNSPDITKCPMMGKIAHRFSTTDLGIKNTAVTKWNISDLKKLRGMGMTSVFHEDSVSVWEDEKVLEMDGRGVSNNVKPLHFTFKNY